eukprot:TRINITY_DN22412_c0_g2_i1.p1 TRINITY_DN22412_c0_g2~~TRINITY_DN22412_c0_g2_i1.p1  ORF type:complete len:648 (-),score=90.56 TRINITY_DN22412_c0_g2_i1:362-2305(-)
MHHGYEVIEDDIGVGTSPTTVVEWERIDDDETEDVETEHVSTRVTSEASKEAEDVKRTNGSIASQDALDAEPHSQSSATCDAVPSVKSSVPKCDHCHMACSPPQRCGRCRKATYCSKKCQHAAWSEHKVTCNSYAQTASAATSVAKQSDCRASVSTLELQGSKIDLQVRATVSDDEQRFQHEADTWRCPDKINPMYRHAATMHVKKLLPELLKLHASREPSEHLSSGLLDLEDLKLPPGSKELTKRLEERLFYMAIAECLEIQETEPASACGAYAKAALTSFGWADIYHRWIVCLEAAGRHADALAVRSVAVARGVWKHVLQRPNALYVPALRATGWWNTDDLPEARALEEAYPVILKEYRALCNTHDDRKWTPIADQPLVLQGDWTDFKLIENGKFHSVNCARCPETMKLIQQHCPDIISQVRGSLIFSRLAGGTMLKPHCGPTNVRIRIHLGLEVPECPEAPRIRVGDEWRRWEAGKCLVFDDSFEHEVQHHGVDPRVVLIADIWHPEFDEDLRKKHLHGRHWRRYQDALASLKACNFALFEPHKVESSEVRFIEKALVALPEVQEAAVVMHLDSDGHQTMIVYIESASTSLQPNDVCGLCAEKVNLYGVSSLVLAVPSWPRLATGEIDREKLPKPPPSLLQDCK